MIKGCSCLRMASVEHWIFYIEHGVTRNDNDDGCDTMIHRTWEVTKRLTAGNGQWAMGNQRWTKKGEGRVVNDGTQIYDTFLVCIVTVTIASILSKT